ncbi:MAG TPA: LysR family transcriptional regulator [Candidatus Brevibacterium intestinigallinarum]|nr:LysR family transcriptional regulator [Candidatus Brevibacterium intestinigallinarum]
MEMQQLRYVLAVAETRNFTRAAAQCFVVQSALSHQVRKLEDEIGTALFARTSRRVELTAAGEAFLPWARSSLEAAERAATEAAAAVGVICGPLTIGLIPTVTALDVPALLRRVREEHPRVTAQLRVGRSDELTSWVRAGEIDLAVLGLAEGIVPEGVEHRVLAEEALVAVVPDDHSLAARDSIDLAELADEPFADFAAGSPGRTQSDRAFRAAGLTRRVPFEASTAELVGALVTAGLAVALLPARFAPDSGARALAVRGGPRRREYLIWSSFRPSPAATAALRLLG